MNVATQLRGTDYFEGGTLSWSTKHEVYIPYDDIPTNIAGVKTPGWDRPRRDGSLVMNYYARSSTREATAPPFCLHHSRTTDQDPKYARDIVTYFSLSEAISYFGLKEVDSITSHGSVDPVTLKRKALERSNREDWNVAVMIAEGHETLAMLAQLYQAARNPTRSLTDAFCRLVKKNSRLSVHKASLSQVFGSGSSAWLTFQLGLYPLIKDIESGYEFIRKRYKLEYRATVRPSASASTYVDTVYSSLHGGGSGLPPGVSLLTKQAFLQQRDVAVVTSDYRFKNYTDLFTEKLGTRFSQTPLLIWEKIPFSFLVDYLVDIGGWLQQVRDPVGLTSRAACYSSKKVHGSILELRPHRWVSFDGTYHWDQSIQWLGGTSSTRTEEFERLPYNASDIPFHPELGLSMSVVRSANVATLAYLGFQRKLKNLRVN